MHLVHCLNNSRGSHHHSRRSIHRLSYWRGSISRLGYWKGSISRLTYWRGSISRLRRYHRRLHRYHRSELFIRWRLLTHFLLEIVCDIEQ